MAQKLYEESNIQAIADAIRGKNGLSDTYKTSEMADAISAIEIGGAVEALNITSNGTYTAPDGIDGYNPVTVNVPQDGSPPKEAFTISGNCGYRFANGGWDWFIKNYGSQVTTSNISMFNNMFQKSLVSSIPFEINFNGTTKKSLEYMFSGCENLLEIPKINGVIPNNFYAIFEQCRRIRYLPENIGSWFDWSYLDSLTSAYIGNQSSMFKSCNSLRTIPIDFLSHGNPNIEYSYSYFHDFCTYCYAIDELINLPIPYTATWSSNAFKTAFNRCYRLKNITFAKPDGQPYVMNWKSQTIDLSFGIGHTEVPNYYWQNITNYNSGITKDKMVTDDATYQALKNDPDWFADDMAYSRYNHDSAVATINSLPDTSAYLASEGGTNTIKFKGDAGSATDGGAINTLTEEEIAVATAKGWTVTLV